MKITEIVLTPVAFRDPPLLNSAGVHEPWALRTIVEIHTLSASSLDSNSISPSPPVCSLPLLIAFPPFDASPSYRLRSRRPHTTLTRSQLRP